MDLFDLTGEVAFVIGGTGVLGGAIAEGLAQAGAAIAVAGRNAERGEARAKKIATGGSRVRFIPVDAMSAESLRTAHETVAESLGEPTILINAAGGNNPAAVISPGQAFENISLAAWRENFDLNLVGGVLLPCQEFGPAMIRNGKGSIINIASVSAHMPLSRVVAYSAAKAAVLSLTQFLAREWAKAGVRVNSITPGFFPAEQNRRVLYNADGTLTERANAAINHTPVGRFGEPRELIGAAIFLASAKASSFVTGTDIRVDGGFLSLTI